MNNILDIFRIRASALLEVIKTTLERTGYTDVDLHPQHDFLYARGSLPVLLVAHTDTVHRQPPEVIFHDQKQRVLWSPHGLGADDRAGVYAIMRLITEFDLKPSVLFTNFEETGCLGARKFTSDYQTQDLGVNFIIELDRRGRRDAVFYDCDNKEFHAYIESFGFITDYGTFTDICEISPTFDIASVNVSVGYVNEHFLTEHLYLDDLNATIARVRQILMDTSAGMKPYDYQDLWTNTRSWGRGRVITSDAPVKVGGYEGYNNGEVINWRDEGFAYKYHCFKSNREDNTFLISLASQVANHTRIAGPFVSYIKAMDAIETYCEDHSIASYELIDEWDDDDDRYWSR